MAHESDVDQQAEGARKIARRARRKAFPELVVTAADGMKSVAYANLVAVLVEAIKAQQSDLDALRAELVALRQEVAAIRTTVARGR